MASFESVLTALRAAIDEELTRLAGIYQQIEALKVQQRDLQRDCSAMAQQLATAPAIIEEARKAAAFIHSLPSHISTPDARGAKQ